MDEQTSRLKSSGLTEDEVKRKFVPFLKDFYRNRYEPMPNTIQVELDNVSAEGLVADGKVTFRKADGSAFVCTYEATSRDKAQEVKFAVNTHYFLWDCAAFGSICAAVAYGIFYQTRFPWLVSLKTAGNLGLIIGVGIIGFFGWYFFMQNWRKYRFIHAIAQFKLYFADEQWIALAEDVFLSPNDPYLLELRNQCTYNGIGLAIVPADGLVRSLNDPSRLGMYGRDRKMADWVTRAQWYQAITQSVGSVRNIRPPDELQVMWNKIRLPFHYLVVDPFKKHVTSTLRKPVGQTAEAYTRFMSAQSVQKWMSVLGLLVIVPLFWQVASFREEELSDLEELNLRPEGRNPEDQPGYLVEREQVPYGGIPTGVPKQYPISTKAKVEELETINLSGDDEDVETINLSGEDEEPEMQEAKPQPAKVANDPCSILRNNRGWIIQDKAFESPTLATTRVAVLRKKGIPCQFAAQSCIASSREGWLVWLGNVHSSEAAAEKEALNYEKALQRYGVLDGELLVRKLR